MSTLAPHEEKAERGGRGECAEVRLMRADQCLEEVWQGIGPSWKGRPLYGASRSGLTPAKEAIGKHPERYKAVEPGTVFYNPMRILLGSIAMVDENEPGGITSPDYVVLRGRPGILHHRVFYYWLRSPDGASLIRELARGGVRERILFNRLCEGYIPVLPWRVQERLAEQLAVIPRARAAAQARLDAAEALPAAYLREVFEGPEASGWESVPLGELCEGNGQYGTSAKSNGQQRGLPVLGMPHIHEGRIRWAKIFFADLPPGELEKYRLVKGDLLFNRTNSAELVGKTATFDGTREAVFASYLIRFRVRQDRADSRFVSAYINSRHGRTFIERHMARAVGQVNISASTMSAMPIPSPPADRQREIMDRQHLPRLAAAERLAGVLRDELAAVEALPAALLREAFGEQGT